MNDQKITETPPNHRKFATIFVYVVVGVMALSLLVMAFRSGRGAQEKASPPSPEPQAAALPHSPSQEDFNRRVEQEVRRRQKMAPKPAADATPQPAHDDPHGDIQPATDETVAPQQTAAERFKDSERYRALQSRVQRSKWLKSNRNSKDKGRSAHPANPMQPGQTTERALLDQEAQEIDQAIKQLERGPSSDGQPATSPAATSLVAAAAQPKTPTVIQVGQPASQGQPMAGQKLIPTGTVVSAVLDQYTMSDYVGSYRAVVSRDVYDISGDHVLIPKGTKITGRTVRIANVNEAIQARMGMPARWFVLPDGKRISLEKSIALDRTGIPAVKDKVNYHLMAQFLGVAAYALISHETSREGSGYANDDTFQGEAGDALRTQFAPLIQKYLNLVPTITLTPGTPLKIFIEEDIYAKPWRNVYSKIISRS